MNIKQISALIIICNIFPIFAAKPVMPITIDPTVKSFDSIPKVDTQLKFFVGTVQDTSLKRDETGVIGSTRTGRRKTAPIICNPVPAIVIKRSVEGLLANRGLKAAHPDSADYTIRMLVLDFELTETSRQLAQTMEANISVEVSLLGRDDSTAVKKYIIKSQNSKSTFDTSKHAGSIMQGAVENALKEIIRSITR